MNTTATIINETSPAPIIARFENIMASVERFRVKNHLRIVEQELRRKNTAHLSPELCQERAKNIARLHDYWTRGLYPINSDFVNQRVPYFKDACNTPCAVAYLMEQSGHADLVEAVAREDNHVLIDAVQDVPVIDWINNSGLTKAEVARVQPRYEGPDTYKGVRDIFHIVCCIVFPVIFVYTEWLWYKFASCLVPNRRLKRLAIWMSLALVITSVLFVLMWLLVDHVDTRLEPVHFSPVNSNLQ